jgi:hypothetical protein
MDAGSEECVDAKCGHNDGADGDCLKEATYLFVGSAHLKRHFCGY